jgi:hypothetical protein
MVYILYEYIYCTVCLIGPDLVKPPKSYFISSSVNLYVLHVVEISTIPSLSNFFDILSVL